MKSMLKRLKLFLIYLVSSWSTFVVKTLRGVRVGQACMILGTPSIRKKKGSSIVLHDHVTLISLPFANPLLRHRAKLTTLSPHARIEFGSHSGMSGSCIVCCNRVTIGDYTIIGPDTLIYDSEGHSYSPEIGWQGRSERSGQPISIGCKCFIGARCTILSGVSIGDNCVISAGSVVTQNVPSGHKASGNPAVITPLPKILGGIGRRESRPSPGK